jgi:hypothetical protein
MQPHVPFTKEDRMKCRFRLGIPLGVVTLACGLALSSAAAVAAGSLPTLNLALTKNTITVSGAEVSGGVNVVSTVSGEASDNPTLILLKPGVTPQQFGQVVSSFGKNTPLDAIDPYGTIVFDGNAAAGKSLSAQADLTPGNYVAVNNGNGFAAFTVTASSSPAALPSPGGTVTAIDFAFRGTAVLHDGELVRFENQGWLIHMFEYARVKNAASAAKAEKLLLAGKLAAAKRLVLAPPGQFAGPLSHGAYQQQTITQAPGTYVLLCLMNAEDGRDHYQLGMYRTIRITR